MQRFHLKVSEVGWRALWDGPITHPDRLLRGEGEDR